MLKFIKNITVGFGWLVVGIVVAVLAAILFGIISLLLGAIGIVGYSVAQLMGGFVAFVAAVVLLAWIIGDLSESKKNR